MNENVTFIFRQEWLNHIAQLPQDQQDKIIGDIVRYGAELEPAHEDDPVISAFVNMVKGSIDNSKERYQRKVTAGCTSGRKKKVDDARVYELAQQGKKSEEIAGELGCSISSVNHSPGWRNRKEKEFVF